MTLGTVRLLLTSFHREVLLQHGQGERLEVLEFIRFAKEVNWDEPANEACRKLARSLYRIDNLLADLFDVNVRPCPVSEFDEYCPWNLHIKDVVHAIALLLDLSYLIFQASPNVLVYSRCSGNFVILVNLSSLNWRLFDLFFFLFFNDSRLALSASWVSIGCSSQVFLSLNLLLDDILLLLVLSK